MRLTITTPWTVKEMADVYVEEQKLFDVSQLTIYSIINVEDVHSIPPGVLRLRAAPMVVDPKSVQVLVVGANAFARAITETGFKLAHYREVKFFASEDDVWKYLNPLLEATQTTAQN